MKFKSVLVGAVAGLLLAACGGGSSPDETTKQFAQALADGDCAKAQEMAVGEAANTVKGTLDAGCEGYKLEIKSVSCTESGETADCTCDENRDGADVKYKYMLKKVDGNWKVDSYNKDMGGLDFGGAGGE